MFNPLSFVKGVGFGAGMMYFFDPISGNRRRALVRDQFVHAGTKGCNAAEVVYRDASNRFSGAVAEFRAMARHDEPSDDVLAARVRSKIGRCSSHPAAIEVSAHDGSVTLQGPVLAYEVDQILANVRAVRGVRQVDNQLELHDRAESISALQGGPRRGTTGQGQLSPTAMAALILGGAGLAASILDKRDVAMLTFGVVGLSFMAKELADREQVRSGQGGAHNSQGGSKQRSGPPQAADAGQDRALGQRSSDGQNQGTNNQSQESDEGAGVEASVSTGKEPIHNL